GLYAVFLQGRPRCQRRERQSRRFGVTQVRRDRDRVLRGNDDVVLQNAGQRRTERALRALLRRRIAVMPALRVERRHTITDLEPGYFLANLHDLCATVRSRYI